MKCSGRNINIIITLVGLSAFSFWLSAQNYTLPPMIPGQYYYEGDEYVNLDTGFIYSHTMGPNFTATVKTMPYVNYNPTPVNPTTRSIDKTSATPVGTVPGSFAVTPTGAATYTVPIEVPPGTNGMQPSLAISYSSQSGNGLLGIGWGLSGISAITRTGTNMYYDGYLDPPDFDNNDRFMLDGQRLLICSGTYGGNNVEYRTPIQNFNVIKSFDTDGDNSPEYFEVYTKNGTTLEYGKTSDSRIERQGDATSKVLLWYLNKVTDVHGNYMEYEYIEDNVQGESYLDKIKYTRNSAYNHYNEIQFHYVRRRKDGDEIEFYIDGSIVRKNKILSSIETYNESNLVKRYEFSYFTDLDESITKLNEITLYNSQGESYNTTAIGWGEEENAAVLHGTNITWDDYEDIERDNSRLLYGDFDGDGQTDFIRCYLDNNRDGTEPEITYPFIQLYLKTSIGYDFEAKTRIDFDVEIEVLENFVVGDFDGDGIHEFITYGTNNDQKQYKIYKYDGDDLYVIKTENISYEVTDWKSGDLNGDSREDLLVRSASPEGYYMVDIYGSDGTSFISSSELSIDANIEVRDFNGDGKADLLWVYGPFSFFNVYETDLASGSINILYDKGLPDTNKRLFWGDFNGDSKLDLLSWDYGGWALHYNNGDYTSASRCWQWQLAPAELVNRDPIPIQINENSVIVKDLNGDGMSDILELVEYSETSTYFNVYYSKGIHFYRESVLLNDVRPYLNDIKMISDFNGDGKEEIITQKAKDENLKIIDFHAYEKRNLVTHISNGFGNLTSIVYDYLTKDHGSNPVYRKLSNAVYPLIDIQLGFTVVSNVSSNNGVGGSESKSYTYRGAKFHNQGLGFLGFAEMNATASSTGITSTIINTFEHGGTGEYYFPLVTSSYTTSSSGTQLTENNIDYDYYFNICNNNIFPYVDISTSEDYLLGTKTITDNTFSNEGNLTNNITEYLQDGNTIATVEIDNYYIDAISDNNPYANAIQRTDIEKDHADYSGGNYTKTVFYDYTTTGLVNHIYDFNGMPKQVTTDNDYYPNGLLERTTISASGQQDRYTEFVYDGKGRAVESVTNTLGHSSSKTYNFAIGKILSSTDVNGNTTTFSYDGMGRILQTTLPSGLIATNSMRWYTGVSIPNAIYYTESDMDGTAPIRTYFDILGRVVEKQTLGYNGAIIFAKKDYNSDGTLNFSIAPHFLGGTQVQTLYVYDDYNRVTDIVSPTTHLEYSYSVRTVTSKNLTSTPVQSSSKRINALGQVEYVSDDAGNITYLYHSNGQVNEIQAPGKTINIGYDDYGRQNLLNDPDAGSIDYTYNAYGELEYQEDDRGNIFTQDYDELGRIITKSGPDETITYTYDTRANGIGKLASISSTSGMVEDYYYDGLGRTTQVNETVDGQVFSKFFTYNSEGKIHTYEYPSGFKIKYDYNDYGDLEEVRRNDNNMLIWRGETVNQYGQFESYFMQENDIHTIKTYDVYGILEEIETLNEYNVIRQRQTYTFDDPTRNLVQRKDMLNSVTEDFEYDDLNRLEQAHIVNQIPVDISYEDDGSIIQKTQVGTYSYDGPQPNAVTSVADNPGTLPMETQHITYNSYNKVQQIVDGSEQLDFTYGMDQQRQIMVYQKDEIEQYTKYYLGNYERKEMDDGTVIEDHYISGGSGLAAIYRMVDGEGEMYYPLTDHLGSITTVLDDNGNVVTYEGTVQEFNYDPWGRLRNPANGSYEGAPDKLMFDRGFTGHEHLPMVGLINMNGRCYDPVLGMFLSPDNYVQAPGFTQSFNRYVYCFNNPLLYTDPTGYSVKKFLKKWWLPYRIGCKAYDWFWSALNGDYNPETGKMEGGLAQKMPDWVPYMQFGYNTNFDGNSTFYAGGNNPNGFNPAIAYNTEYGVGYGNAGGPGNNNFYYPSVNYNAPEQNAAAAISQSIYNYNRTKNMYQKPLPGPCYSVEMEIEMTVIMYAESTGDNAGNGGGDVYYGTPESQTITIFAVLTSSYVKLNQVISNGVVPIISEHMGTMSVLKGSKYVPYLGWFADIVGTGGATVNGINYGWTTEHVLDFSFSIVGFIPFYGDGASLLYFGGKEAYSLGKEIWNVTLEGISNLTQPTYWWRAH